MSFSSASSWKKQSSRLKTGTMNVVNNESIYGENATFNYLEAKFAYISDLSSTTASFTTISAETAYLDTAYVNDLYITNLGQNNVPNDRWLNVDASNGIYVIDLSSSGNYTSIGGHSLMKQKTAWGTTAIGYDALRNISTRNDISFANTAVGTSAMYGSDLVNGITGIKNAAFGANALSGITTGSSNSAFGANALSNNTSGLSNTAAGESCLNLNNTGMYNVGVGSRSLLTNSTGSYNAVCGSCSMSMNISGSNNVACGHNSLTLNTTGCNNAAIGYNALFCNNDASANTAIGASSMLLNTSGINNVAIGYNALYSDVSGSYNTVVGAYSDVSNTMLNRIQIIGYNNNSAYSNVNIIGTDISASGPSKTFIGNVADSSSSLISNVVMYDPVTKEMSYDSRMLHKVAADASGYTNIILGDLSQNTCIGGTLCLTEGKAIHSSSAKTFGMISPISTFLRIGKIVPPYPATDSYLDFNNTGGSAIYGSDFFNINPPTFNINSTTCDISSSTFKLRNIGTTSQTNFLAYNPIDGLVTYNPTTAITNALLASNNTWSGTNTFSNNIYINSANTLGIQQPSSNILRIGHLTGVTTDAFIEMNTSKQMSIYGTGVYLQNIPTSSDANFIAFNSSTKQISYTPSLLGSNNVFSGTNKFTSYVGIGTNPSSYPLEVINPVSVSSLKYYDNAGNFNNVGGKLNICLKVSDGVLAVYYAVNSDKRIKNNIVEIDDEKALQTLRLIKPKTYDYIDKIKRGNDNVIGFIAQEIQAIIPKAVTITKDYIPSFYTLCQIASTDVSNIVVVTSPIDLSWNPLHDPSGNAFIDAAGNACSDASGNKCFNVKLYDNSNNEIKCKTTDVLDKRSFLMETSIIGSLQDKYFLHGQEVDDFHNIDKSAIFTVVTAAVQDIDRIQQAQSAMQQAQSAMQQADAIKIEALEKQLKELQNKYKLLEDNVALLLSKCNI